MKEANKYGLNNVQALASVAYDLEYFETKRRKDTDDIRVIHLANEKKRTHKLQSILKMFAGCVFIFGLLSGIVLSTTQLNELTVKATNLKEQNEELLSEQKRLQAQFDMMINIDEVEDRAINNLYMQKVDEKQINYIALADSDVGVVTASTENFVLKAINSVKNSVLNFLEFAY